MAGGCKLVGDVKARAQAGLPAHFCNRREVAAGQVRDQDLDGIGADVNYGAAFWNFSVQVNSELKLACRRRARSRALSARQDFSLAARRARTAAPMMPASSPVLLAMISTPLLVPLMA